MDNIKQSEWINIFKNFLEKEELWKRYSMNVIKYSDYTNSYEFLKKGVSWQSFNQAFNWNNDKFVDWSKVNNEWQKYRKQISSSNNEIDNTEVDRKILELCDEIIYLIKKYSRKNMVIYIDAKDIEF
jgi:ATP:corrinoid adenosyltransferase